MGTINDKLQYLRETKALMKKAITEKGAAVSETDTFRRYPEKIEEVRSEEGPGAAPSQTKGLCFYIDGTCNTREGLDTANTYMENLVWNASEQEYLNDGANNSWSGNFLNLNTWAMYPRCIPQKFTIEAVFKASKASVARHIVHMSDGAGGFALTLDANNSSLTFEANGKSIVLTDSFEENRAYYAVCTNSPSGSMFLKVYGLGEVSDTANAYATPADGYIMGVGCSSGVDTPTSAEHYENLSIGMLRIWERELKTVELEDSYKRVNNVFFSDMLFFSISPDPLNAEVSLIAEDFEQSGNSIAVSAGTKVTYNVYKNGYKSESGTVVVNESQDLQVVLQTTMQIPIRDRLSCWADARANYLDGTHSDSTIRWHVQAGTPTTYTKSGNPVSFKNDEFQPSDAHRIVFYTSASLLGIGETKEFTMECTFTVNTVGAAQVIFGAVESGGMAIRLAANGGPYFSIYNSSGENSNAFQYFGNTNSGGTAYNPAPLGKKMYVCCRYKAGQPLSTFCSMDNRWREKEVDITPVLACTGSLAIGFNAGVLTSGATSSSGGMFTGGTISSCRFYSRCLDEDEVMLNYEYEKERWGLTPFELEINPKPSNALVTFDTNDDEPQHVEGNKIILSGRTDVSYSVSAEGFETVTGTYNPTTSKTLNISLVSAIKGLKAILMNSNEFQITSGSCYDDTASLEMLLENNLAKTCAEFAEGANNGSVSILSGATLPATAADVTQENVIASKIYNGLPENVFNGDTSTYCTIYAGGYIGWQYDNPMPAGTYKVYSWDYYNVSGTKNIDVTAVYESGLEEVLYTASYTATTGGAHINNVSIEIPQKFVAIKFCPRTSTAIQFRMIQLTAVATTSQPINLIAKEDGTLDACIGSKIPEGFKYSRIIGTAELNSDFTAISGVTSVGTTDVTLAINPIPADAKVVITAEGYTQEGNAITVPIGTEVSYSAFADGYLASSGTLTLDVSKIIEVPLEAYTELEYLERTSGAVAVDLGFYATNNTKVVTAISHSGKYSATNASWIIGSTDGNATFRLGCSSTNATPARNLSANVGGVDVSFGQAPVAGTKYNITMSTADGLVINGTKYGDFTTSEFTSTQPFYLFGVSNATTNFYWGKIYATQLYEADELVYDLVPALTSAGEYGFVNKVNGILYKPTAQTGFSGA